MKQGYLILKINQIFIYKFKRGNKSLKSTANKPLPLSPLPFLVASFIFHPIAANAADITEQLHRQIDKSVVRQSTDQADTLLRIGQQQHTSGKSDKAIESWLQALEIYHSLGDLNAQGLIYDYLGRGYVQLGRYKEAENAIRRRLAIARDTHDFQSQIFALNNIGTLLLQQGEPNASLQTFAEAVEIARHVKN
ncbi:hypothetical protein CI592_03105, partial [Fischerella thermalis CCMEE 5328]